MGSSNLPPLLIVEEIISDDCISVSDSLGLRLLQKGDFLFFDDEIVSGEVKAKIIEEEGESILLQSWDVVYYKLFGSFHP